MFLTYAVKIQVALDTDTSTYQKIVDVASTRLEDHKENLDAVFYSDRDEHVITIVYNIASSSPERALERARLLSKRLFYPLQNITPEDS